ALATAPRLVMPLFITMGTADRVAKLERARAFFDAAGSKDKIWNPREGSFNEVLSEPEWPVVAESIADFVLNHTGG
ncbi:MAG: hypothetical protein ACREJ3_20080, partial [Polyangiaceae bacterium]